MSEGAYVRGGLCPRGPMSEGAYKRRGLYPRGLVKVIDKAKEAER